MGRAGCRSIAIAALTAFMAACGATASEETATPNPTADTGAMVRPASSSTPTPTTTQEVTATVTLAPEATLTVTSGAAVTGTPTLPATATPETAATATPTNTDISEVFGQEQRISCTKEVIAARRDHTQVLLDVKRRHESSLNSIPGVLGVGVGFVYIDGKSTEDIGIVILIDRNVPLDSVDPDGLIPSEFHPR